MNLRQLVRELKVLIRLRARTDGLKAAIDDIGEAFSQAKKELGYHIDAKSMDKGYLTNTEICTEPYPKKEGQRAKSN